MDLEKFLDRVNHDILMARVARKVKDKRILSVIRSYLESGVMTNGVITATEEGTPQQGGPLSPLLANILLDDLDKELEQRGLRFVRYADDANIYVRTKRAGERVMNSVRRFLQERLRLRVNEAKSAADRPWRWEFLGFSLYKHKGIRIRPAPASVQRVKGEIRKLARRRNQNMAERIYSLNCICGDGVATMRWPRTRRYSSKSKGGLTGAYGLASGDSGSMYTLVYCNYGHSDYPNGLPTNSLTAAKAVAHGGWTHEQSPQQRLLAQPRAPQSHRTIPELAALLLEPQKE